MSKARKALNALRGIRTTLAVMAGIAAIGAVVPVAAQAASGSLTRVGDLSAVARPQGVPLDYVVTPNGFFHASCVQEVADGESVLDDGSIARVDGSLRKVAACAHPSFGTASHAHVQHQPEYDGWLADSLTDPSVSPPSNEMNADWIVPAAPTNVTGQTLYFFPGLESVPKTLSILQPVLAWNGFSDEKWTMTNWNCCIRGSIYHGSSIAASTGDQIIGLMHGKGKRGTPSTLWQITSQNATTGESTSFNTGSHGQVFDWYFGGVMEVYGVNTCDQLPASGKVDFTNVAVYDVNLKPVTPVWSTEFNSTAPACGYVVTATTNETVLTFTP